MPPNMLPHQARPDDPDDRGSANVKAIWVYTSQITAG